jgi:zinc transport system substrate-binding protein
MSAGHLRHFLWGALALGLLLAGRVAAAEQPLRLVASLKPLQMLAIAVVGQAAGVDVLLDARFSPHDYQLRPSDRARLEQADVVFWVGPALETFLREPLATLPARVQVVALAGQASNEEDAHVWLAPSLAIAMARRMAEVLGQQAPLYREQWRANAERLAVALTREDEQLRAQLAALPAPRPYMVAHDGYRRFETHYGLHHVAALANGAEQTPGARNVLHIQQLLADGAIGCVLQEPQYVPKVLRTLLRDRPVRVVTLDTLAAKTSLTRDGFAAFYRDFGRGVVSCLEP